MSRQFWIIIAVLLIASAIYYPFVPHGQQSRNMKLAEEHIVVLMPLFSADSRFAQIELSAFTGEGGSLLVYGEVATKADVDAADRIVKQSNPPCPVAFRVHVASTTIPASQPLRISNR